MTFLITSSLLGAVNFLTTIIQLRAPGMTYWRMSFFCWSQFVTSFLLLLLAFPPLQAAGILQLMDRVGGTSFFMPTGLVVSGQALDISGGGSPLLVAAPLSGSWRIRKCMSLILPALGIVADIVANNTRKPLWGFKSMVYALIFLGFMSFIVWAHHMFITGMGTCDQYLLPANNDDYLNSIGDHTLGALHIALGRDRYDLQPRCSLRWDFYRCSELAGLTGLPLGLAPPDIHLHDTYYVIGHFHYVVAPGDRSLPCLPVSITGSRK